MSVGVEYGKGQRNEMKTTWVDIDDHRRVAHYERTEEGEGTSPVCRLRLPHEFLERGREHVEIKTGQGRKRQERVA